MPHDTSMTQQIGSSSQTAQGVVTGMTRSRVPSPGSAPDDDGARPHPTGDGEVGSLAAGIRIANAPCSWGALEFEGMAAEPVPWERMLDELAETGYVGTDLGDWGYLPTHPATLRAELDRRGLDLVSAFVPVAFSDPAAHAPGLDHALRVARLLAEASGEQAAPARLVLADDNGTDPIRTRHAGRITPEMELADDDWRVFAHGVEEVARAVFAQTGVRTLFHHHCAGYVETPAEIDRFLDLTDPDLVGLVFDTGHYAFGSGAPAEVDLGDAIDRHAGRIHLVHAKDCDPTVAGRARAQNWDYFDAVRHGVFCELGRGAVDFDAVIGYLACHAYGGWIVVEQDVLPGLGSPRESAARNRVTLAGLGL